MTTLLRRLEKLESMGRGEGRRYQRLLSCIVRKGHEAEDQAQALAEIGASVVEDRDFVILRVVVTPDGRPHDPAFRPSAMILPGLPPQPHGLKTIRGFQHGR